MIDLEMYSLDQGFPLRGAYARGVDSLRVYCLWVLMWIWQHTHLPRNQYRGPYNINAIGRKKHPHMHAISCCWYLYVNLPTVNAAKVQGLRFRYSLQTHHATVNLNSSGGCPRSMEIWGPKLALDCQVVLSERPALMPKPSDLADIIITSE